jgi:hypothetical protein
MNIPQIIVVAGALSILAIVIGLWIQSKTQAPTSAAITKDVLDQIVKKAKILPEDVTIDLGELPQTSKPNKKRKYYPKKPKTQL